MIEAKDKISTDVESLEFNKHFDVCFIKLKSNKILLNKNSHRVSYWGHGVSYIEVIETHSLVGYVPIY